tara:strand:- start:1143 stop:1958 length:816 start_codon:yes stop_codon:yes gene_type:complete
MEKQLTTKLNAVVSKYNKDFDTKADKTSLLNVFDTDYVFNNIENKIRFEKVVYKSTELMDFKNKKLLRKELSLQEQIKALQEQLLETENEIKQNEEQNKMVIEETYKQNKVVIEKKATKQGNKTFNKERNYEEYFKEGEVFLHRLATNDEHKDKELYGAIKLTHDIKNTTNIWKCKYSGEGNNLIGCSIDNEDEEYNSFKEFMTAHNEFYNHEVKINTENAFKGSIKVIRQSIKEARGKDKDITILKLSCLSKLEELENYYQPRPRINLTK